MRDDQGRRGPDDIPEIALRELGEVLDRRIAAYVEGYTQRLIRLERRLARLERRLDGRSRPRAGQRRVVTRIQDLGFTYEELRLSPRRCP